MSKQLPKSFFIFAPFKMQHAGFYQDFFRGVLSYEQLVNRLIHVAEHAHAFRQLDKVKEIGEILANFPTNAYQAIGYYYLAVSYNNRGRGDLMKAGKLLTLAADVAPSDVRAKAMLSLAAVSSHLKDTPAELRYFTEALRVSRDITTGLTAYRGISVHKAREGYHKQALLDLEKILPMAHFAPPHIYFDILNSYAVELGEVGRKEEARNIMRHVLASPFAPAYPEWRETAEDLRPARRSFVAAGLSRDNVLMLPERESSEQPTGQLQPARVLDLAKWRKLLAKKYNDRKTEKELNSMSVQDMGFKLLELITQNRPDRAQMRAILDFALNLFAQRSKLDPDGPAS